MSVTERRNGFTVGKSNVPAGVPRLSVFWDPRAILRRIALIHVVAFKRQSFFVSVCKRPIAEWLKCVPFFANSNSAPSVVMKHNGGRIGAAVYHCRPSPVKASFAHTVRLVGFAGSRTCGLLFVGFGFPEATAIGRDAAGQVGCINPSLSSALAGAEPEGAVASSVGSRSGFMLVCSGPNPEGLVC